MKKTSLDLEQFLDIEILQDATTIVCVRDADTVFYADNVFLICSCNTIIYESVNLLSVFVSCIYSSLNNNVTSRAFIQRKHINLT